MLKSLKGIDVIYKISLYLIFFACFSMNHILANGGPVSFVASNTIGEIVFTHQRSIDVENEELLFKIENDTVLVDVQYELKNISKNDIDVSYAFPVDAQIDEGNYSLDSLLVDNMTFKINGSHIRHKHQVYHSTKNGVVPDPMFVPDSWLTSVRRVWFTTEFSIKANSSVLLSISYNLRTDLSGGDDEFYKVDYGSARPGFRGGRLFWNFTPAVYWGSGKSKKITVKVDAKSILEKAGKISFKGLEFIKKGFEYEFVKDDFDFKKYDKLEINYGCHDFLQNQYFIKNGRLQHADQSVKASSRLSEEYPPSNMLDGDLSTAWVEGKQGGGVGEYVEITDLPHIPMLFVIVPGYTKSESTYKNNNRIKEVELEISYYGYQSEDLKKMKKHIKYPDGKFNMNLPGHLLFEDYVFEFGRELRETMKKITRIKVIIKDVYKGDKYDDSCISEILCIPFGQG